jgi:hypothetical protein
MNGFSRLCSVADSIPRITVEPRFVSVASGARVDSGQPPIPSALANQPEQKKMRHAMALAATGRLALWSR